MEVCPGGGSVPFNTRQRPSHATWNRKMRPSGMSLSSSDSLGKIGTSPPSQFKPEPRPPRVFTGSSAGRMPRQGRAHGGASRAYGLRYVARS
jgi:hypothetical protein